MEKRMKVPIIGVMRENYGRLMRGDQIKVMQFGLDWVMARGVRVPLDFVDLPLIEFPPYFKQTESQFLKSERAELISLGIIKPRINSIPRHAFKKSRHTRLERTRDAHSETW